MGKATYNMTCFACHANGIAGAPKLTDKAAWASRLSKSVESLYDSALHGKVGGQGSMPPKGGNIGLSDEQVKAAVDYMAAKSQ